MTIDISINLSVVKSDQQLTADYWVYRQFASFAYTVDKLLASISAWD